MSSQTNDTNGPRVERGAMRLLQVLGTPQARPRAGLMQHEFHHAFNSDGWTMADFRTATHYAYEAGWIALDNNLYRLTVRGEQKLAGR